MAHFDIDKEYGVWKQDPIKRATIARMPEGFQMPSVTKVLENCCAYIPSEVFKRFQDSIEKNFHNGAVVDYCNDCSSENMLNLNVETDIRFENEEEKEMTPAGLLNMLAKVEGYHKDLGFYVKELEMDRTCEDLVDSMYYSLNQLGEAIDQIKIGIEKNGMPMCYTGFARPVKMWTTKDGEYTTVEFNDGDKVTVHAEHPEKASEFAGFCIAFTKKLLRGTTMVEAYMNNCKKMAGEKAARRKEMREFYKQARQEAHQRRIHEREMKIAKKMEELYLQREAEKRMKDGEANG